MASVVALGVAAAISALLIVALFPLMRRYAMARPNARSSHRVPTPQGGGIAVVGATLAIALGAGLLDPRLQLAPDPLGALVVGTLLLALVGAWDDIRPIPVLPRLAMQAAAVCLMLWALPAELRLLGGAQGVGAAFAVPLALERALLALAALWFVNLVNFMDGLDWITIALFAPAAVALAAFAQVNWLDPAAGFLAAGLAGALLGFAPFNRPVAKLFLGDVGSLPIGLVVAFLLFTLAGESGIVPALLLVLYPSADATITLARRLARRERVWEAHRSHFYQQATDNGFTARGVAGHVLALNIALAGLATMALAWPHLAVQIGALAAGSLLVGLLMARFATRRRATAGMTP